MVIPSYTSYHHTHHTIIYIIPSYTSYHHTHHTIIHIIPSYIYHHKHHTIIHIIPSYTSYHHTYHTIINIIPSYTSYTSESILNVKRLFVSKNLQNKLFALLRCYAAYVSTCTGVLRHPVGPVFKGEQSKNCCPTGGLSQKPKYQHKLRNISEEQRPKPHFGGNLKYHDLRNASKIRTK